MLHLEIWVNIKGKQFNYIFELKILLIFIPQNFETLA